MPQDEPMTMAEAIRLDVLAGRMPEVNPGDLARFQTEEDAKKAAHRQELENLVDASLERARTRGDL